MASPQRPTLHLKRSTVSESSQTQALQQKPRVAYLTVGNPSNKQTEPVTMGTPATAPAEQTQSAQTKQASGDNQAQSMLELAQSMVNFRVLSPFASCVVEPRQLQEALDNNYNEIYVWHDSKFYRHQQLVGENRFVRLKVDGLPSKYKEVEKEYTASAFTGETMNFLPGGKIPGEMWDQIVEFFRQVMRKTKQDYEAHCWILWTPERGYFISVPKQTVSKASVSYSYDQEALPQGAIVVIDMHSHNTMGAFYSGTDNNNDRTGIYFSGVIGKITDTSYEWVMRFNLLETKRELTDLSLLFDLQKEVAIPSEWLDQVEVQTYASGYKGYQGKDYSQFVRQGQDSGKDAGNEQRNTSVSNPAKWSFPSSQQQQAASEKGGAGSTGQNSFRFDEPFEYGLGGGGYFGSLDSGDEDVVLGLTKKPGDFDAERNVFVGKGRVSDEMKELMKDMPKDMVDDMKRLDDQATAWLLAHGYTADGEPIETSEEPRFAKGIRMLEDGSIMVDGNTATADDIEFMEVGSDDDEHGDQLHTELFNEIKAKHGKEAARAYELIDTMITSLESADEALLDIARQCYGLMSEDGRMKLATNGF